MNDAAAPVPIGDLCPYCKHPFDPHELQGYGSPPTEGWMRCQVQGCDCKMTWSLPPEQAARIKAGRGEE